MRKSAFTAKLLAVPFVAAASLAAAMTLASGDVQAADSEVVLTITHVRAVDKMDVFSKGDFYGRVTIDGEVQKTPIAKQQAEISPGWVISKRVAPGKHDIKLEILDKDISVDDPVDINRIDPKRDLDFTINTRNCRIEGFAQTYRCGTTISRTGGERKAAEVSFKVDVKK